MYLIVGATGLLGSEICRQLAGHDEAVRALVRGTSNPGKVAELTALGVEAVRGDLKDAATLREACRGASAIVSTASSTISRQPGDSIQSVDGQGQLDLVEAAADAGVGHFVLISFPEVGIDFPLQRAKRAVEDRLDWLFDFYRKQQEERRWYGYWNYGDVMHTYDADRHEWRYDVGGFAWDNSELSTDLWLWLYYLRTGRAEVFHFAEAMTRHTGSGTPWLRRSGGAWVRMRRSIGTNDSSPSCSNAGRPDMSSNSVEPSE